MGPSWCTEWSNTDRWSFAMLLESFRSTFERWQASSIWHFSIQKRPYSLFRTPQFLHNFSNPLWRTLNSSGPRLKCIAREEVDEETEVQAETPQMWILSRFVFCQVGYKAKEVWQVSNWPRRLGEFWVALTIFLCAEQEDKNWFCHWSCLMQNRPNKSCLNCCLLDKCRSCKISDIFKGCYSLRECRSGSE